MKKIIFLIVAIMLTFGLFAQEKDIDYEKELIKIMDDSGFEYEITPYNGEIEKLVSMKGKLELYTDFEKFKTTIEQQSQSKWSFVAIIYSLICPKPAYAPIPFNPLPGEYHCSWGVSDPNNEVDGIKFYIDDDNSSATSPSPPAYIYGNRYDGLQPFESDWTAMVQLYRTVLVWIPSYPFGGHWVELKIFDDTVYTTTVINWPW